MIARIKISTRDEQVLNNGGKLLDMPDAYKTVEVIKNVNGGAYSEIIIETADMTFIRKLFSVNIKDTLVENISDYKLSEIRKQLSDIMDSFKEKLELFKFIHKLRITKFDFTDKRDMKVDSIIIDVATEIK